MSASLAPWGGSGPRGALTTGLLVAAAAVVAAFIVYAVTRPDRSPEVVLALPGPAREPTTPPAAAATSAETPSGPARGEQVGRAAQLEGEAAHPPAAPDRPRPRSTASAEGGDAAHDVDQAAGAMPSPFGLDLAPAAGPDSAPGTAPDGPPSAATLERLLPVPIMTGAGDSGPGRPPAARALAPDPTAPPAPSLTAAAAAYRAGDYASAYAQWKPLAERDVAMAEFGLGALFVEGRLGAPDRVAGYRWLARAAGQGFAPAARLARDVAGQMTEAERGRVGLP